MGLNTHERQKTDFFVGTEVERTAMYGEKTLFIVGVHETHEIIKRALANGISCLLYTSPSPRD